MPYIDWGQSGRTDEYWFELVDPFTLDPVGEVEGNPENSSVTYGYYTDNLREATIDLAYNDFVVDGREMMIRIGHNVRLPDGNAETEYLGTFFVTTGSAEHRYKLVYQDLQCYGPMYALTQDYLSGNYTRKKGQTIYGRLQEAVLYAGSKLVTGPDVDQNRNHTKQVLIEIGTNRAECVRKVAGWAGWQFSDSDRGEIVLDKYVAPANRPVVYTFEGGENCVYLNGYTESRDDTELCNRVVAWWSRDKVPTHARKDANGNYVKDANGNTVYDPDDEFGLSDSVTLDLPDDHALSRNSVGRRMTATLNLSDPCSHADLVEKARSYLSEHSTYSNYIEIEHANIPNLRAGQVVRYQNDIDVEGGINYLCEITEISIGTLGPMCMCQTKLKVLNSARQIY